MSRPDKWLTADQMLQQHNYKAYELTTCDTEDSIDFGIDTKYLVAYASGAHDVYLGIDESTATANKAIKLTRNFEPLSIPIHARKLFFRTVQSAQTGALIAIAFY